MYDIYGKCLIDWENRSGLGSRPAVIWPADQDQIGPVTTSGQAKDTAVSVRVSALGCPDPMHGGGAAGPGHRRLGGDGGALGP